MEMDRRRFLKAVTGAGGLVVITSLAPALAVASRPKNAMLVEVGKCIGCMRCVAACQAYHDKFFQDGQPGTMYTKVPLVNNKPFPQNCMHCVDAPCATVCQSHALTQLSSGTVTYDKEKCIGCLECTTVCPFNSITFDPVTKKIFKCDFCSELTENGREPSCVTVCPPHAKTFGPYDQKVQEGLSLAQSKNGKLLYAESTQTLLVLSQEEFDAYVSAPEVTVVKAQYPDEYKLFSSGVKWLRLAWLPFLGGVVFYALRWRGDREQAKEVK